MHILTIMTAHARHAAFLHAEMKASSAAKVGLHSEQML